MIPRSGLIEFPCFLLLTAVLACLPVGIASADESRFRLEVDQDGVYRVDYEQLLGAGLAAPLETSGLMLLNRGEAVPIHVQDGDDGRFGPGDSLVFVGRHLRGDNAHFHDFSPFNVYWLSTADPAATLRMSGLPATLETAPALPVAKLRTSTRLEQDLLRIPLSGRTGPIGDEALWYWRQLNHLASEPTRVPVDLSHLDTGSEGPFDLRLRLRGHSDYASASALDLPDHVVEVSLNGTVIGQASWRGREVHTLDISGIDPALVATGGNHVELRVPMRRHGRSDDPVIDVVYLDWIEIAFARDSRLGQEQVRIDVSAKGVPRQLRLSPRREPADGRAAQRIEVFGDGGFRIGVDADDGSGGQPGGFETVLPPGVGEVWVVPDGAFMRVASVELDRASSLAASTQQRDYFIIAHASLIDSVAPLARFHQSRGMSTELVDVQDIYDEFNFGIRHPGAIRDFLAHARRTRQAPAPSHVLLVGDASWYLKQHGEATAERSRYNERNLIPAWTLRTRDGPAASDQPYVMLEGDDFRPEMAIGRFPAADAAEAAGMVDKTIRYLERPPAGPWRSRVMLVSDREGNLSARNAQLAQRSEARGLDALEFLPTPAEDPAVHQQRLRTLIDDGMLVLHFFGHGGRFMWQTAPAGGSDGNLFDMEDLDALAASDRLPIVLSMSCNTGPFDHPAADSLAEKFLRLPDRGAIAVLAASARNSPSLKFTNALLEGILSHKTLGEAILDAKNQRLHHDAVLLYNLFGDPALVPALP